MIRFMQKRGIYVRVVRLCQSLWVIKCGRALCHVPNNVVVNIFNVFWSFVILFYAVGIFLPKKP